MLGQLLVPELFEHNASSTEVNVSESTGGMHFFVTILLFPQIIEHVLKDLILKRKRETLKGSSGRDRSYPAGVGVHSMQQKYGQLIVSARSGKQETLSHKKIDTVNKNDWQQKQQQSWSQ